MDFQKAIELISKSKSILLTTHIKPDGDACGCLAAMQEALASLGKKVELLLLSLVPDWYELLFTQKVPVLGQDVTLDQLTKRQFDLVIIIDTDSYSQLPQFDNFLKQTDIPILVIDHHATTDNLGDVELLDPTAAATCLIVLDLFKFAHFPVTGKIAGALFVAIATDTGWFQFGNTGSRVFLACAELIDAGAKPTQLYHHLYQNFSLPRFNLMLTMLSTLEFHLDGRYATQHILQRDFQKTGATFADTENLINECHRISTVKVSALFTELKDGRIRLSLRSTCPAPYGAGACPVNVSKIAQKFGGGGHPNAAGAYLFGPLDAAKNLILSEITAQFKLLDAGHRSLTV
jgi:phosphoesterase RecJ-like protein